MIDYVKLSIKIQTLSENKTSERVKIVLSTLLDPLEMKIHWVWGLNKDKWIRRKGEYWAKVGVLSHRERERERDLKIK